MKKIIYFISFISLLWIGCETASHPEIRNTSFNKNDSGDGGYFELLRSIDLQFDAIDLYSNTELRNKYQLVLNEYSNEKYENAARATIIRMMVAKNEMTDADVIYFLEEIQKFDMAYPKENFILLKKAFDGKLMTDAVLRLYTDRAYKKGLAKSYLWEPYLHLEMPADEDTSQNADVHRGRMERYLYTQKLKDFLRFLD